MPRSTKTSRSSVAGAPPGPPPSPATPAEADTAVAPARKAAKATPTPARPVDAPAAPATGSDGAEASADRPRNGGRSGHGRPGAGAAPGRAVSDSGDGAPSAAFLASQREALLAERRTYLRQADELKAQADSLALEHEPGDVQFDEEGGEGGTSNVDRELDLLLSAQARGAVEEIDRALLKIQAGTYGRCEQCGRYIPEARLEALPHASLCVVCKAGGLASRR
jgi:DnaK suppressor protein